MPKRPKCGTKLNLGAMMAHLRKTHSGGRPRSNAPRCKCGKYTAKLAEIKKHKCSKGEK